MMEELFWKILRHRDLHTATFLIRDPAGFIDGPSPTDVTTGKVVTHTLEDGFGLSELAPGSRAFATGMVVVSMRFGTVLEDGARMLTHGSNRKTGSLRSHSAPRRGP